MRVLPKIFAVTLLYLISENVHAQAWNDWKQRGDAYRTQRKPDSAIYSYQQAMGSLPVDSMQSEFRISLFNLLGSLYYNTSQYLVAEQQFIAARDLIRKKNGIENHPYALNTNLLGQVYSLQKKNKEAEQAYLEARNIWEKVLGKNSKEYAFSCNALGILYNDSGEFEKAEQEHQTAVAIREKIAGPQSAEYAQSCNNLAALYWNLGHYDKAEPLAIKAKEIRGKLNPIAQNRRVYAISCVNLANIYRDMGKYEQAEPLYIEARAIRDTLVGKMHDDYALSCDILADLYLLMGKYDRAETIYLEAKSIREKIGPGEYFYGQSCSNLSALYRNMKRYEDAEKLALEAGAIWKKLGDAAAADAAINYNSLGTLYFMMGRYADAEQNLFKARDLWKKNLDESHPYYTDNSLMLGKVYWKQNRLTEARALYDQSFEAQQFQSQRMFAFTSESEKESFLKNISNTYDEYLSFYFSAYPVEHAGRPYDISLSYRNQILASSRKMKEAVFKQKDSSLMLDYNRWSEYKRQLAALYSKADSSLNSRIAELKTKADDLEKDLVKRTADKNTISANAQQWKSIARQLAPGEAAIEFSDFNYFDGTNYTDSIYYVAQVIKKDMKEPTVIRLFEKKSLDSLLQTVASGGSTINTFYTRGFKTKQAQTLSRKVYNVVWSPLEKILEGTRRIYFAPSGLLHRLAFHALPYDSGKVLSDKFELVQLSSTSSIIDQQPVRISSSDSLVLYGGIFYNKDSALLPAVRSEWDKRSGFNFLPGTRAEVRSIAAMGVKYHFRTSVLLGYRASEKSVHELDGPNSPAILHIATHGFFFDESEDSLQRAQAGSAYRHSTNPLLRSGLMMAGANEAWTGKTERAGDQDGILTSYEVSNLYLPNTKLVVLSACETALGDLKGNEGVYGLQRAFKMAGCEYLLMSLWKVPDQETSEFMQQVYQHLFKGETIEKAFQTAQRFMRNKYAAEPFKWAAWILVK